jgi:hypothetical protein
MLPFYRLNANYSYKREPYRTKTFAVFSVSHRLTVPYQNIWRNLLEKLKPYRDAFLYEKALKTYICAVRFAPITVFSLKNEIFSSTNRAFYKNAQIFTAVRLALTLL